GAVVALALLAGLGVPAYYVIRHSGGTNVNVNRNSNVNANTNRNANTNVNANTNGNSNAGAHRTVADLVELPGGTFKMGRDDVPPMTDELKSLRPSYLLWMYSQWPAHVVVVKPFAIDRTEVTNAEYAQFVKETGHQPPAPWDGD